MNKRKLLLLMIDATIIFCSCGFVARVFSKAASIAFNFEGVFYSALALCVICLVARYAIGLYSNIWRYSNTISYMKLVVADFLGYLLVGALGKIVPLFNMGVAMLTISCMFSIIITLVSRFCYSTLYAHRSALSDTKELGAKDDKIKIAIIGAGNIGVSLADELMRNPKAKYEPCFFIDNDRRKAGNYLRGLKIYFDDESAIELVSKSSVQEVIIAIPDATQDVKNNLFNRYSRSDRRVRVYDYPFSAEDENSGQRSIRDFSIEELLFRDPLSFVNEDDKFFCKDQTVLVTGGGGSIGSELCRQIAAKSPKKLIIFDIYENNAYDIQQELIRRYGDDLSIEVIIASVTDKKRVEEVFDLYSPDYVFHAAAHKHVPLMENNAAEAIKNNVFGTYNVANAAEKYGARRFILISTDKAVNPTNVMGASKRLCEMIVQCRHDSKTEFVAVRFGNVLGSNGSVIPLFKRQIQSGGPITLTDKRIIRYFMTIPEAVQLVIEAASMAEDGDLFVLDMGNPVKILDLAENMIRLSGFVPYEDIDIVEIGLRPGEKLYEELLIKSEQLSKTSNGMIFIEHDAPISREDVDEKLEILSRAVNDMSENEDVIEAIRKTVPTYHSPEDINKTAEKSMEFKQAFASNV